MAIALGSNHPALAGNGLSMARLSRDHRMSMMLACTSARTYVPARCCAQDPPTGAVVPWRYLAPSGLSRSRRGDVPLGWLPLQRSRWRRLFEDADRSSRRAGVLASLPR